MFPESHNARPVKKILGHDNVLNAIRRDRRQISVQMMNADEPVCGILVAYDQYTLSVDTGTTVRVMFKHAMESFEAVPRAEG
jgi:RNA chaperone Hfq